jgi:hypothetical protein
MLHAKIDELNACKPSTSIVSHVSICTRCRDVNVDAIHDHLVLIKQQNDHIAQLTSKINEHEIENEKFKFARSMLYVGAKAKTLPFAGCLRQSRCTNGGETTGGFHPSSTTRQDEGLRRGRSVSRPRPTRRPTWNLAHCNRPRASERITGPIFKGFSVMTVCNPALWEYFGDDLGA